MTVERGDERVGTSSGATRVVRAFEDLPLEGGVEDHELHVGKLLRDRDEVLGTVVGEVEPLQREALVRAEHPDAEIVRPLDHREPDRRIVECEPVAAGSPCGVRLERRDASTRDLRVHHVERCRDRREVRREHALGQHAPRTTGREVLREVGSADRVRIRHRSITRSGVGDVGQHRDGRIAGEKQIVHVVGAVQALELVRGGARLGHEIPDHVDRRRRGRPPGSGRHHVVRVHVHDQLAAGSEHRFARRAVRGGRGHEVTSRFGGRRGPRSASRRVRRARVEHREAQGHPRSRLEELAATPALPSGDGLGPIEDLPDDRAITRRGWSGHELPVSYLAGQDRERRVRPVLLASTAI